METRLLRQGEFLIMYNGECRDHEGCLGRSISEVERALIPVLLETGFVRVEN